MLKILCVLFELCVQTWYISGLPRQEKIFGQRPRPSTAVTPPSSETTIIRSAETMRQSATDRQSKPAEP